jgi:plastocyanin
MMSWMAIFWIALIAGAIWLAGARTSRRRDAADILDQRLARGEIGMEEHNRLRGELGRGRGQRSSRAWLIGGLGAGIIALVAVPVAVMAANGWDMDMWEMHGGGSDTSSSPLVQGGREAMVTIDDFAFRPGNLEVERGARVTWTNRDGAPHDATARGDAWSTERLSEDESDTLTFDTPGTYDYSCSIHPSMKARLVVR